ncbi:hypothetical protein DSM3645_26951 [Blastopirellula marina DSM 3645]|uniref:Uncharacterized protein n=1 Tax=Blastopirellula marina DSM 3645 TaxID=314230 RepID=A3ZZU6_9BACT|nr:hypothetical protein DSM3645_26951 [Blastopirellula marina DSM 3645]
MEQASYAQPILNNIAACATHRRRRTSAGGNDHVEGTGGVSLTSGDLSVALDATTRAVIINPDDVELLGDLAVVQLRSGGIAEARVTIEHALRLDAEDQVTRNVHSIVTAVASGKRKCPSSLTEMMQPLPPKSWRARLFGW